MAARPDCNGTGFQAAQTAATGSSPRPRPDAARDFRTACINAGLMPGDVEASGGRIIRCPAAGDKAGRKSGWFVFFNGELPAGAFGDWRSGESGTWCARSEAGMSPAEAAAYRCAMDRARGAREAERAKLAGEAGERAARMWAEASDAAAHPYLEKKGVASYGLKLLRGRLLVPAYDAAGTMRTLQEIDAAGEKRFLFGGEKKGNFFVLPGSAGTACAGKVAVAEGYATAATVHAATGWTVLVAFDAGNLSAVAEAWRKKHPRDDMLICGDDDAFTPGNPGRVRAAAAAGAAGAAVLLPDFSELEKAGARGRATDWNDLQALSGLDAVKRQLDRVRKYRITITDWLVGPPLLQTEPRAQEWLVHRTFAMASVNLLAAMGGAGKSMLALDLALKVASTAHPGCPYPDGPGVEAFGNPVSAHGPVAMFTAEDNRNDVHRRIWSLAAKSGNTAPTAHPFVLVPLPSAGGPLPLVLPGGRDGPQTSPWWSEITAQLARMRPRLIIFDPLASFALVDLNKPEVADFTMSLFASLADETGACVLVTHHLAKTRDNIATPEAARMLVRGSTAIVDRTRATYVLWSAGESQGREICAALGEEWHREKVYRGCVAKENSGGDKSIKTFVRGANGLLTVRDAAIGNSAAGRNAMLEESLAGAIAAAAAAARPFAKTGANGLYARRSELPAALRGMGKHSLELLADTLLLQERAVLRAPAGGIAKNRLHMPEGPIARAEQRIQPGSGE